MNSLSYSSDYILSIVLTHLGSYTYSFQNYIADCNAVSFSTHQDV